MLSDDICICFFNGMQLIGDTVCYLSRNGESEDSVQNICRYSLTDRELTSIPIHWKDDGHIREIYCYAFDENCNVWLIANVYSADYSQFRRFLYKFDPEGQHDFLAYDDTAAYGYHLSVQTKEEMLQYLMMFNEDAFIDWETGECHFDSAQFKAMLEFVNLFPDSIGSGSEEISLPSKIQNGDVLFAIANIQAVKSFQLYEEIFGETAACVGFPTMDGKGGTLLFTGNAFGISAGSENKIGAWDFIESVLMRNNADSMNNEEVYHYYFYKLETAQLPTMKNAMSAIIDYVMETDKEGKFGTFIYNDGWRFTGHALTWDEINVILDLIPEATPYFSIENDEIVNIINEEAGAYYSGQRKVDDVVSVIQNRVQLYVNENK